MSTPYGNYRSYYPRRRAHSSLPPDRDERLALLEPSWFRNKRVLDVGCNVGCVSVEIAQRLGASRVVGVDIDAHLISLCVQSVTQAFSTQRPQKLVDQPDVLASSSEPSSPPLPPKKKRKVLPRVQKPSTTIDTPEEQAMQPYFPSCFPTLFEPIPLSAHKSFDLKPGGREGPAFPGNLVFHHADWTVENVEDDAQGYDVILALSLTKWIHLNTLDAGLLAFFHRCYSHLLPGGRLVLEKQGWAGYKDAKRGSEKLKQNYFQLKLRPDDFSALLLGEVGFERRELVRESDGGKGEGFIVLRWSTVLLHPQKVVCHQENEDKLIIETAMIGFDRDLEIYVKAQE